MELILHTSCKTHQRRRAVWYLCGLMLAAGPVMAQAPAVRETVVSQHLTQRISGVVTDAATKKPLLGVRVFYKNLTTAITDENGAFSLAVPGLNVSVSVDMAGYQTRDVAVDGRKELRIALNDEDSPSAYKTVMLPNQAAAANRMSAAVASADMSDVWTRQIETADSYLQGKLAGLNVVRHSGSANAGATLSLRGYTSLLAGNQPLIVVDNVIYDGSDYGSPLNNNFFANALSNIDMRDISNITVLKDAAAAAVYGTKAANGVVLITTSRAKNLGTRIDLAMNGGMNLAPASLPVLNAGDYRTYLSDVLSSGGLSTQALQALPYMNDNTSSGVYYQYHNNTDWQKKMYSNRPLNDIYLKVTGGDNIAKYALSINYAKNNTALSGSTLGKYSTRFNADLNLSARLKGNANLSFSYNEATTKDQGFAPRTNPVYLSLVKAPILTDYMMSGEGVASPDLADEDIFNVSNPSAISQLMQAGYKNYRFLGAIGFQYQLRPNLILGTNVGVVFDKVKENRFVPRLGVVGDTLSNIIVKNQLGSQTKRLFNISNDTYLAYTKTVNYFHEFSARLGMRFLNSKVEQDRILGYNSATDELVSVGNGTPILNKISGGIGQYNWLNTYLNLNYAFADKYFLSYSMALDGSSRFGKSVASESVMLGGTPFAVMPAVSAAWLISSEKFMANTPFDLLKLRASVGRVGNDNIGNYSSREYYVGQNLLGMQGLVRGNIANPNLKWESVTKTNLGLDVSVLNERVSLSLDVYQNRIKDMLMLEKVPVISGLSTALTNSGTMTTRGIELGVNVKAVNSPLLKWDVGLNLGRAASVVNQLPDDNALTQFGNATYITRVGQAPNLFYGHVYQGVFATDAAAAESGLKIRQKDGSLVAFKGGDARFLDVDGNKIIDDNDRQTIGNPNPKLFGALMNRVSYKNLTIDALCTFVSGNSLYNYTRSVLESVSGSNNQTQAVLNRWRGQGQVTDVPRAAPGDPMGNARFSSRWIEDGSYFRVRTVSASYNIPVDRDILKYVTIYAAANNLFTATRYLGYDPEFSSTNSLFGQGVDNALEPVQKSVQLGVKLGL